MVGTAREGYQIAENREGEWGLTKGGGRENSTFHNWMQIIVR